MRILLVEDDRKVADFMARSLRESAYAVDAAPTGEEALCACDVADYDLVILDLRLPGVSGLEVCRELRRRSRDTPILMVTARSLVEERVEGLDAGADDYLVKPFEVSELQARVRALLRRNFGKLQSKLRYADLQLDRHRRRVSRGTAELLLTSKEYALLELLLLRAPDVVERSEILSHVWDAQFDSGSNIVEVYINRLREKLHDKPPHRLIHNVRGIGYRLARLP